MCLHMCPSAYVRTYMCLRRLLTATVSVYMLRINFFIASLDQQLRAYTDDDQGTRAAVTAPTRTATHPHTHTQTHRHTDAYKATAPNGC
jgi:hypothetical protein